MNAHRPDRVAHGNDGEDNKQGQTKSTFDVVSLLRSDRSSAPARDGAPGQPTHLAQLDHPVPPAPIPNVPLDIRPRIDPNSVEGRTPAPNGDVLPAQKQPARQPEIPLPRSRPKHLGEPPHPPGETRGPQAYDIVKPNRPQDPKKPHTIAVLDEYYPEPPRKDPANPGQYITNGSLILKEPDAYIPHGEVIAQAAEQNGFNVIRLQDNTKFKNGFDHSQPLKKFYSDVLSGKLPLKRGDFLNLSLAQNSQGVMGEPTFGEANEFLGMKQHPITPGTVNNPAEQAEIFAAMRQKLADPKLSTQQRDRLQQVIDTNTIIDKIQKDLGINVIVAAGNQGATRFQWDFLTAKERMGATTPDGKHAAFSALGTKEEQGDFPVVYSNPNVLDKRPLAQQVPGYSVEGANVFFSAVKHGGPRADAKALPPMIKEQDPFSPKPMVPPPGERVLPHVTIANTRKATSKELTERLLTNREKIRDLQGTSFAPLNYYRKAIGNH